MSLSLVEKQQIITDYQRSDKDRGSSEVQVALLTEDIRKLTEHFKIHAKDHHSHRGLMGKVNRRRKLLRYLRRTNLEGYRELIKRLGLRESRN